MHNGVTSHLWLKSALHASSHPCMCTCVLRLGCFLLISPVFYFVPPFSFQPFLMFTSEFNERSRSNPLCDFRLGTVATSDHETPLTERRGRAVCYWTCGSGRIAVSPAVGLGWNGAEAGSTLGQFREPRNAQPNWIGASKVFGREVALDSGGRTIWEVLAEEGQH